MQHNEAITKLGVFSGTAASLFGAITLTEMLAIGGFVVAVLSLVLNFWYKKQLIKLEYKKMEMSEGGE